MEMERKKTLAIYGAAGLGREVLELAGHINRREGRWAAFVFIDDGDVPPVVNGRTVYKYDEARAKFGASMEIVIAVGEPAIRERLFQKVVSDGFQTPVLTHPDVYVPETTSVGAGAVIHKGAFVSCGAVIGDNVYIQPGAGIGHDCVIGESTVISTFCALAGAVDVGRASYIGLNSCVREGVAIGEYCIIGMASAVHKDVPDGMIAMGNPARVIQRNEKQRVFGKHG